MEEKINEDPFENLRVNGNAEIDVRPDNIPMSRMAALNEAKSSVTIEENQDVEEEEKKEKIEVGGSLVGRTSDIEGGS